MLKKKTIRRVSVFLAILLVAAGFVVEKVLPYSGIKPLRHNPEDMLWLLPTGVHPGDYNLKSRTLSIQTPDTVRLSAMLIEPELDTPLATVVLLHGISGCKETQLERARLLADAGYASLLLDLRAHGKSGGEYCTFGYYEKHDLRAVADTLEALFPGRAMGIWGTSLGGAITLQSMAIEPRYRFGIVESTFDEFDKVAMEYGAKWFFGIRSTWLTNRVIQKSGQIAHFDPDAVKPVRAAGRIDRPVLFLHGEQDSRIPLAFGKRNFDSCAAEIKYWHPVVGAGHNNLWKIAGDSMHAVVRHYLSTLPQKG